MKVPEGATRTYGRYHVVGVLARGGMGTVYLARSIGLAGFSRTVALKVLHPHFAEEPQGVAMFLAEARPAARIARPTFRLARSWLVPGASRNSITSRVG